MVTIVRLDSEGRVIKRASIPDGHPVWEGYEVFEGQPETLSPPPETITPRQLRLWLLNAGKLTAARSLINTLPDDGTRATAQIEWDYAIDVKRYAPLVTQISALLGMTESETDEAFREASTL